MRIKKDARLRLDFESIFFIQIKLFQQYKSRKRERGYTIQGTDLFTKFYKNHLPFKLTDAQQKVLKEIYRDIRSGHHMNRLLQGDVGSGKTIVAFLSMLLAIDSGYQTCLMAPTEVLAHQHYIEIQKLSKELGIYVIKLTGSMKEKEKRMARDLIAQKIANIVIGTHAIIQEKVVFKNLGLSIIDEQHRFGVAQRSKLWAENEDIKPHVLIMTATPIPRTLAMTLYYNLDVSTIDSMPLGRKPIITKHFYHSYQEVAWGIVEQELRAKKKVYLVYPIIEESETLDYQNLKEGYEKAVKRFSGRKIAMLHGKMKSEEKEKTIMDFAKGDINILVATTVIEVGIDVPKATIIVIESAERFGLSQLHQLRGRVGRSSYQSYCVLITGNSLSENSKKRMKVLCETGDGFEIANQDLKIRGPGDMGGTKQSGVWEDIDLLRDAELLKTTKGNI